jgi:hypothetical protein
MSDERHLSSKTDSKAGQDEDRIITEMVSWLGLEEREGLLTTRNKTMPFAWKDTSNMDRLCEQCSAIPWSDAIDFDMQKQWISVEDCHLTLRQTILNAYHGCHFCSLVLVDIKPEFGTSRWPRRADAEKRETRRRHYPGRFILLHDRHLNSLAYPTCI